VASWRRRWLLVEYVLLHMVQRCLPETVDVRGDGMCCESALASEPKGNVGFIPLQRSQVNLLAADRSCAGR
jgi:hypothetical protein